MCSPCITMFADAPPCLIPERRSVYIPAITTLAMRQLLITLLLISAPVFAQSGWRVASETDAMTDKVKKSAMVRNEQGHELSVYRGPNGAAWVLFSLAQSSFDTLSPGQAPIYRVDKLQAHDLDSSRRLSGRGLGLDLYRWEPRWVNFSIWHGKEDEGRSVQLAELMSGQSVVFRYFVGTGGYKETSFTLVGAATTIAEALDISPIPDPAVEAKAEAYKGALSAASTQCRQDMGTLSQCIARVTACQRKAQRNLELLQECLR